MKKLVSLILALVLVLSCSALAELNPNANTFPVSDETIAIDATVFGGRTEIEDWETNDVTLYWENKMGIDIIWNIIPSATAADMVSVTMASGDLPDVMFGGLTKDMAVAYGAQGFLLPLNDMIDEWGTNMQYLYSIDERLEKSITAPDGYIYFLPEYRTLGKNHTSAPGKMIMNMTWLENVGKAVPTTTDELYDVLKAFKEQDANGNGDADDEIPLYATGDARVGSYIMQAFTYLGFNDVNPSFYYTEDDGTITATYATEGWKEGLAYMAKLYAEGLLDPECFLADAAAAKMLTGAENGTRIGAAESYSYSGLMDLTLTDVTAQYAFIEPLKNADGKQVTAASKSSIFAKMFIAADSDVAEAAFRWGDALLHNPLDNDLEDMSGLYGNEGEGWRRAEEGEVGLDGVTPAQYAWLFTWGQPNNDNLHESLLKYMADDHKLLMAAVQDPSKFNQEAALLNATVDLYLPYAEFKTVSPMLMFAEDEVSEVSQLQTDIETYAKECKAAFITGKMDVEADWDSYLAQLESWGLSTLLEYYQTAYTRQFGA